MLVIDCNVKALKFNYFQSNISFGLWEILDLLTKSTLYLMIYYALYIQKICVIASDNLCRGLYWMYFISPSSIISTKVALLWCYLFLEIHCGDSLHLLQFNLAIKRMHCHNWRTEEGGPALLAHTKVPKQNINDKFFCLDIVGG